MGEILFWCKYFVVTFVVIWCVIFVIVRTYPPKIDTLLSRFEFKSAKYILDTVDTFDLLFLSGRLEGENVIKVLTGSYYSHVSLLIREADIPYVWEADLGSGYRTGPRIMRLEDKLSRWKGDRYGMVRRYFSTSQRPQLSDLINIVKDCTKLSMNTDMMSWLFSSMPDSYFYKYFTRTDSVFCSELVADTLQKLGMMVKVRPPSYYSPQDFASDRVPITSGFYGLPIYFSF